MRRSIFDLQFSGFSGDSSSYEDNSHEFLFSLLVISFQFLLDLAGGLGHVLALLISLEVNFRHN